MDEKPVTQADVVIAGGSLVGALTGLMLAQQRPDWRIVVCEPRAEGPPADKRIIALAAASAKRLQSLGALDGIDTTPIKHIHISDRGFAGAAELHAEHEKVEALGRVVSASELVNNLYLSCQKQPNLNWLSGVRLELLEQQQDQVELTLDNTQKLQTKLLIGADGQNSLVREQLELKSDTYDYGQFGCIATLDMKQPLDGWAFERFTEAGPIALLPMQNSQASLVWSFTEKQREAAEQWSDTEFLHRCQQAFGYRAGLFTGVSKRVFYPLILRRAKRSTHHRSVIIGNASHALHPIAGQGFNLGLRDTEVLCEVLATTDDPGHFRVLQGYEQNRERDYQAIIKLTDGLVRGFSNHYLPTVVGRNSALMLLQHCSPLKSAFARLTMGMKP
ncbi:2-octaprenyl-6-methoxyphenol hydroxylase /2-octaprenyl-3-methyl-6-methoxy-1,4-benzoquinol hydroxylase [Idiomarina loihiensis]|uniref:2-octaprenyl-6-methoxyphenyl hydroxylase n=1 Tax=Idiomarina TaxID=135575 RepID=UPI000D71CCDC|nr:MULTISPECIES: 2-octaprenyl-6-methoxyphenyl hydroxylase [Idiomarina]PWW34862.1 2-octaprenyl-6-methoxyphenol hydroxylase /2-octaprenyl-3-methyl-6-methoxy-1,4-benzoquinol hydroxylase [Idiomarina loihiensis]TDP44757.1 2-octaprenyl-6-methoxyphenol hydroxylase /2-octaprenyl-3-methyl-6-methoxy-1,4-benzoquinol hydroxylase [Idiomarina loihiensis]TDS20913.1 2-octaprenyl-6-methoxyphenol hydroxylase /2-octaprenyl-3-methyl-6-methoxy-1,4-benzoquinol hydroxylase [Idiomarina sp. H2]